jgi:hypothetical protein
MGEPVCAVAADTKLETPEGPMTIGALARTPASVFTRMPDGKIRFAMLRDITKVAEQQPVVRVRLASGLAFRVARSQALVKPDGGEVAAGALRAGDELSLGFAFPAGYAYRPDGGGEATASGGVAVTAVEEAGAADVYTFRVNGSDRFLFSAGVLGRCES